MVFSPRSNRPVIKPDPDPTEATHVALNDVKEQLRRESVAMLALINARLDAIETAATTFSENLNRVPTAVESAVANLKELHEAKLDAIRNELLERDKRYALVSTDAKSAVADALAAQKESVFKQDTATQKSIDQQSVLLTGIANGLGVQISDLKDRVSRSESSTISKATTTSQIVAWIVAAVALSSLLLSHFTSFTSAVK